MKCPKCNSDSRVIDTRDNGTSIQRRRICARLDCGERFSTVELSAAAIKALSAAVDTLLGGA